MEDNQYKEPLSKKPCKNLYQIWWKETFFIVYTNPWHCEIKNGYKKEFQFNSCSDFLVLIKEEYPFITWPDILDILKRRFMIEKWIDLEYHIKFENRYIIGQKISETQHEEEPKNWQSSFLTNCAKTIAFVVSIVVMAKSEKGYSISEPMYSVATVCSSAAAIGVNANSWHVPSNWRPALPAQSRHHRQQMVCFSSKDEESTVLSNQNVVWESSKKNDAFVSFQKVNISEKIQETHVTYPSDQSEGTTSAHENFRKRNPWFFSDEYAGSENKEKIKKFFLI